MLRGLALPSAGARNPAEIPGTRPELRLPTAAAQARIVSGGPEFGLIPGNLLGPSKGYFFLTFLSSSPTCPATQSGLCCLCPAFSQGSRGRWGTPLTIISAAVLRSNQAKGAHRADRGRPGGGRHHTNGAQLVRDRHVGGAAGRKNASWASPKRRIVVARARGC